MNSVRINVSRQVTGVCCILRHLVSYYSLITFNFSLVSLVVRNLHERLLYLSGDVLGVRPVTDDPALVRAGHRLPADWAGLVVDIPLLYAGHAVGVSTRQDQVRPPLYTDAALLH